jgi:DNA polymerase-3 subunit delta
MIIFLYGPDSYRSSQKLKEIEEEYKTKHKSGLNFQSFEWSGTVLDELKNILSSVSMFEEKKLAIVKNACSASKADQEGLIEILEEKKATADQDAIVVFFEAGRPTGEPRQNKVGKPEKSELFSWLVKKVKMAECFENLSGAKLSAWVKKEIEKIGSQIQAEALEKLVSSVGSDLWQMRNEVDKLISFKADKLITEKDVDLLVRSKYDPNIFATIDALAARNKNLAYKLMHQHLSQGENEIYILTMFVYQFRNLLQIKSLIDAGISSEALVKKTGLHPFVIKKSWSQLRNFSQDVLKKIYERLLKLDIAIKRGKIEPQTALDLIVGEIAS